MWQFKHCESHNHTGTYPILEKFLQVDSHFSLHDRVEHWLQKSQGDIRIVFNILSSWCPPLCLCRSSNYHLPLAP